MLAQSARPAAAACGRLWKNRNFLCKRQAELSDDDFNPGGLAIRHGIGPMDGKDQFEAEATAAVSQAGYFTLQKLPNRELYGPPLSRFAIRLYNSWAVYHT